QGIGAALEAVNTQLRLFAKPDIDGRRRLGVALARDIDIDSAICKALDSASKVKVIF
ncbi:MAG: phosphoribosylglycinamide formyltransferase 2, partial [Shewanella sp.]|nr:phosphoribosylglycinamide formyltransferase 2 [Shewanella sp.]